MQLQWQLRSNMIYLTTMNIPVPVVHYNAFLFSEDDTMYGTKYVKTFPEVNISY